MLPDGGQLSLDWENRLNAKEKCIMLILPGLTGNSKSCFCTHYVDIAKKKNCMAVCMNYRGIFLDLLTPRLHCATDQEDLGLVLAHIKNLYPDHCLIAVGISIGTNKPNCK
jgi:predicted alpha/beta-fold hydrolase